MIGELLKLPKISIMMPSSQNIEDIVKEKSWYVHSAALCTCLPSYQNKAFSINYAQQIAKLFSIAGINIKEIYGT